MFVPHLRKKENRKRQKKFLSEYSYMLKFCVHPKLSGLLCSGDDTLVFLSSPHTLFQQLSSLTNPATSHFTVLSFSVINILFY